MEQHSIILTGFINSLFSTIFITIINLFSEWIAMYPKVLSIILLFLFMIIFILVNIIIEKKKYMKS